MSGFKPSYDGIGRMLNSPEMEAAMGELIAKAKAHAEATAPLDPKSTDGTHYKDSFETTTGTHGGYEHDRAYGRLSNTDAAALWIELGTRDTPKFRTIGKSLDALKE